MNRRSFLTTAGAMAAATKIGLLDFASSLYAAQTKPTRKPHIQAVFARPKVEKYWMGWPGAAYDIKARQADYTRIITSAAKKFGVQLDVMSEPLDSHIAVSA